MMDFQKPKKYETVKELEDIIQLYFDTCDVNTTAILNRHDEIVQKPDPLPYTIEGLCVALDCDRKTLLNYEKNPNYSQYFHTVKRAKAIILKDKMERGLMGKNNSTIALFDLKNNYDYLDRSENIVSVVDPLDLYELDPVQRDVAKRKGLTSEQARKEFFGDDHYLNRQDEKDN